MHLIHKHPSVMVAACFGFLCVVLALAVTIQPMSTAVRTPSATQSPAFTTETVARQTVPAYTPNQLETAYGMLPLLQHGIDGSGETIALVELDRFAPSDIQGFDAANQLAAPSVKQVYIGGKQFSLPNTGEATMDVEWAHAFAPGATIAVYYLRNGQASIAGWKDVARAVSMAVANGANTISLSFGACRPTAGYSAASKAFASAVADGAATFVSSGDDGARPGPVRQCGKKLGVAYPASDPSVVSVGGTSLLLNSDSSIAQESAWMLSGGGKGSPFARPAWQITPNLTPGRYRFVPDVSFLADATTGAEVFWRGRQYSAGGTSLGAPAWAAIWTLVRDSVRSAGKTIGSALDMIYRIGGSTAYLSAFNDITSGSNGRYHAAPGWDPVTGWGTPNVAGLAAAAESLAP